MPKGNANRARAVKTEKKLGEMAKIYDQFVCVYIYNA